MTKLVFSLLSLLAVNMFAIAQKKELTINKSDKGLYVEHKVAARESYYSIGRLYNVHPKSIASYNKLDMNNGLQIDQKMKIPLTDTNFTQKGNSGTPVYYKTNDDVSLSKVSKENNDVLLSDLRHWNALASDDVKKDTRLIVGFLKSKEMPSVTIDNKPVAVSKEDKPVAPKVEDKKEEKPAPPVVETKPPVKVEPKPVEKESKEEKPQIKYASSVTTEGGQGYFKSDFEQQIKKSPVSKEATVTGGIFKTTSGWEDAKYYMLMDGVSPGTIIKITNPSNNKAVYAKVLGEMSGIRQNQGLNIRISNAGAASLGITEQDKFIVKVNY
jgi:LysM repeat protein